MELPGVLDVHPFTPSPSVPLPPFPKQHGTFFWVCSHQRYTQYTCANGESNPGLALTLSVHGQRRKVVWRVD